MLRTALRSMAWAAGAAALALHIVVMTCFAGRWDKTAAVTVFPIWTWAIAGLALALLAWAVVRARFLGLVSLLWLLTLLICPDEWRGLRRSLWQNTAPPARERPAATPLLRVATLNCKGGNIQAVREAAAWQPDVLLLQEMRAWSQPWLRELAKEMWGGEGSAVFGYDTAILARGKLTPRVLTAPGLFQQFVQATLEQPDGRSMEVLSVHLQGHVTDMRLWRWQVWRAHAQNQRRHRLYVADTIARQLLIGEGRPCLIGGDFNSPAGDRTFQTLEKHFDDAFATAGSGWGNTFRNDWPLLRIDQIWATSELRPTGARAIETKHSDHRLVVADYAWK